MALYFNNQPQSRSAMLGSALGGGLGAGVNNLLEHKMEQLSLQRDQAKAYDFGQAIGLDPKMARAFSQLDPKSRQDIASNVFIGRMGRESNDNINPPPPANKVEELSQQFAPKSSVSDFNQQLFQDMGFIPKQAPLSQFGQQNQQPAQQQAPQQEQVAQQPTVGKNKFAEDYELGKIARDPRLKIANEKLQFQKGKALTDREQKEKEHFDKKYEKYNQEITDRAAGARRSIMELDSQINILENSKQLNKPAYLAALQSIGADWPFLLKGDTIALNKGSINLAQKMLDNNFGSRKTNFGFEKTLEAVPNALHNPKDALDLAYRIKASQQAEVAQEKARDEIIAENNGYSPKNLTALVQQRAKDQLDSYSLQFNYALPDASNQKPDTIMESYGFKFSNAENPNYWKRIK